MRNMRKDVVNLAAFNVASTAVVVSAAAIGFVRESILDRRRSGRDASPAGTVSSMFGQRFPVR
jgi:hypothetical protein